MSATLGAIQPDITYSRYMFPTPGIAHSLDSARRLVLEINSDDLTELAIGSPLRGLFNQAFRKRLLSRAHGLVFVTEELATNPTFSSATGKRAVIANGIDVSGTDFATKTANRQPQLCFTGSPQQAWHGIDKLLALAQILPDCEFHIIGPSRTECLALWRVSPTNVHFHGYLPAADTSRLVRNMDVAISTLALHRKRMGEACPLKMREYLAHGIPVIIAHKAPDIADTLPFVLKLPNVEDNILPNAERIQAFVRSALGNTELRQQARASALEMLNEKGKETQRHAFFRQVLERNP